VSAPVRDRRQRALDAALLGLVVLVCGVVGLPEVVASLREGSFELATVFYPVLLVAFAGVAWSRRTGA
jgi:hypothetical protein